MSFARMLRGLMDRIQEPSTWIGLALVGQLLGDDPMLIPNFIGSLNDAAVMGLAGMGIFMSEKSTKK